MWIMLNNAFVSIVSKDCEPRHLCIRARRKGDIERALRDETMGALVIETPPPADYRFRAYVRCDVIKAAMAKHIEEIDYPNFKDSVMDGALHDAYLRVWQDMAWLPPGKVTFHEPKKKRTGARR